MLELEHGVVKFYDDRDGKKFGFLTILDKDDRVTTEDIFFHLNDQQFIDYTKGKDDVEFVGKVFPGNGLELWHLGTPKVGDRIVFSRESGSGGKPKASPWARAEMYDKRIALFGQPYYQVTEVMHRDGGDPVGHVIWSGQGLDGLLEQFAVLIRGGRIWDTLTDRREFVDGGYQYYSYLYHTRKGGVGTDESDWKRCSDPRPRPNLSLVEG